MKGAAVSSILIAVLLALGVIAKVQQATKIPWIGFLVASSRAVNTAREEAFLQGLRDLGYLEGKNIVIEWRTAEGKLDRVAALAAELVSKVTSTLLPVQSFWTYESWSSYITFSPPRKHMPGKRYLSILLGLLLY
jgi:ABC-type uncharacterized transport system substrate-binding protein